MATRRALTGFHRNYKDPDQLRKWLKELRPVQVQINFARTIKRGRIEDYSIESASGNFICVSFSWLCSADYPQKSGDSLHWKKLDSPTLCMSSAGRRVRDEMRWVPSDTENTRLIPIRKELSFRSYYLTRANRIKIRGNGQHWRLFGGRMQATDDFWRFFPENDVTNLIENPDGTFSQKETII